MSNDGDGRAVDTRSVQPTGCAAVRRAAATAFAFALAWPASAFTQSNASAPTNDDLLTRATLGGDWGGLRRTLERNGIGFDLWATGLYQGTLEGTGNHDFEFGGRADLLVNGDTAKMALWDGGGLHAHLTYRGGPLPGWQGGALLPANTSGVFPGASDELVATSLYLSQRFGDSTRLMLGKINAIDLLARHPFFGGWGTDRFLNVAFVAPPSGVVPPVFMGAVLTHAFAPFSLTLMAFDPNDQTTNYSLNHLFADGVNVSLGLAWTGAVDGRASKAAFTATYSTAEGINYSQIGLPPGSQTTNKRGSYNVAIELSHLLVESTQVPGNGLGLYAKAGMADGNPNPFRSSFVGGVAGYALVSGRPLDYFGIGYFYYNFSNELKDAVAPIGSFQDEQGMEAYYCLAATPWLRVTADLQWINPATGPDTSVWVGGLRVRVAF